MIKWTSNNLKDSIARMTEVDTSSFFDVYMPAQLLAGKNEIRIKLIKSGIFEKYEELLIDVLDSNNNPIYHYISNIANEDNSRSIIIDITDDVLNGNGKLYLLAKFASGGFYLYKLNLIINNSLVNNQHIKFNSPPIVTYTERQLLLQKTSSTSRLITKNGTGNIFQKFTIVPQNNKGIEQSEITNTISNSKVNNNIGSSSYEILPTYLSTAIIHSDGFEFSSSMKSGIITLPHLQFSASIINVINSNIIEIWPPYSGSFSNIQNFTCSYYESSTISNSNYSQSYCVFDFNNLITECGIVDSVDINYKVLNQLGTNYQPLGTFKISNVNKLIDNVELEYDPIDGVIEKQIGSFKTINDFQQYWITSSNLTIQKSNNIINGIELKLVQFELIGSQNTIISLNPNYRIKTKKNDELVLSLNYYNNTNQQLDLFISGTSYIDSLNIQQSISSTPSGNLGSYIGSLNLKSGKNEFSFISKNDGYISPVFQIKSGSWSIGDITIKSLKKRGYNPSSTKVIAPLDLPSGSEVNFKIDYLNPIGKRLENYQTTITNVFFNGSTDPIYDRVKGIENVIGSYVITGSNQFNGNQSISGSVNISSGLNIRSLASSDKILYVDSLGQIQRSSFLSIGSNFIYGNGSPLHFNYAGTNDLVLYPGGTTPAIRLFQANGYIGVNKSSAAYPLDISGSVNMSNNLTVSGSLKVNQVEYASSSTFNRVLYKNNIEQERIYSSSYITSEWLYSTQSIFYVNNTNNEINFIAPILKSSETNLPITSSVYNVSYAIQFENHLYGVTGSLSSPQNTFNWSSTTQFRLLMNPFDSVIETPKLSGITSVSSSQYTNVLGGYGTTFTGKPDLNSWYSVIGPQWITGTGNIRLRTTLTPTSSFNWTIYASTFVKVIKHEIRI